MFKLLIAVFVTVFASPSFGADLTNLVDIAKASPTLKVWMEKERQRLTPQNVGYRMSGSGPLCDVMRSVKLGCSYNERGDLVTYLYAHGVNLFPCSEGSNPYTKGHCDIRIGALDIDMFNYVGQANQNTMLWQSIEKNRALFVNGDLTATAAKKWRK